MNTLLRSSLAALLLAPAIADAQAPAAWSDFTRLFQAYIDSDRVVGASVALIKNGHVVSRLNTGFADRTANVRTDDQTIYHWGSITKALTAISIMQLRDRQTHPRRQDRALGTRAVTRIRPSSISRA